MRIKLFYLLGLLIFPALCCAQVPIFAVTAGSSYTDSTKQAWTTGVPDCAAASGAVIGNYPSGATISGAKPAAADSALYNTEEYGPQTCTFNLPNGSYAVLMKFAELWYGAPSGNGACTGTTNCAAGQRIFNVSANGTAELTSFDIAAAAGGALKAIDKSFTVNVTNGKLQLVFTTSPGSPTMARLLSPDYSSTQPEICTGPRVVEEAATA